MNEITIKIDSKLLKEIIGGEANIELRKGIVENFTNLHLKTLLNDEDLQERIDRVEKNIMKITNSVVKESYLKRYPHGHSPNLILADEFKKKISIAVRAEANTFVREEMRKVRKYMNEEIKYLKEHYDKEIPKTVHHILTKDFERRVQDEINRRIDSLKGGIINDSQKEGEN